MAQTLYLEGSCGISGDMTAAALYALGGDPEKVSAALAPLAHEGLQFRFEQAHSYGIAGCRFITALPEGYGKDAATHPHAHAHHHPHRHLADIEALLATLPLGDRARSLAQRAFRLIAEAEAEAHGASIDSVHFHEVGALDSLADIVASAVLAEDLGVEACVVSSLTEGSGTVHCAHGDLSVPVPAVLNIARATALPLRTSAIQGERITPTGIALAAALRTHTVLPERFLVKRVGIGIGERDFGCPNLLRAMLLESPDVQPAPTEEEILEVEANLDDCTGETLAIASQHLFAAGALDVALLPCTMKRGRPGTIVKLLAPESALPALARCLFQDTTTIGLRYHRVRRICMERTSLHLETPLGPIAAKRCSYGDFTRVYPESESVREVAERHAIPYPTLFAQIQELANASTPRA